MTSPTEGPPLVWKESLQDQMNLEGMAPGSPDPGTNRRDNMNRERIASVNTTANTTATSPAEEEVVSSTAELVNNSNDPPAFTRNTITFKSPSEAVFIALLSPVSCPLLTCIQVELSPPFVCYYPLQESGNTFFTWAEKKIAPP